MSLPAQAVKSRSNQILHCQNGTTFSPNSGTSVIRLQIANTTHVLKSGSLKLNGQLQVRNSSGDAIGLSHNVCFNNWGGIQTFIDSISIYSLKSGVLLENIKNYGQYVSKRVATLHGSHKLNAGLQNSIRCSADGYDETRIASQVDSRFSLEIMSGLLHASEHFTMEEIGGLLLEVNLAQSASALFDQDSTGGNTYSLVNVRFSAIMLEPTAQWQIARARQYVTVGGIKVNYDSADIRVNQLVSNNDSINDTVNFASLKSMSVTLLLATESNSQDYDQFEMSVKDVTETSLSVNGLKHPYKFSLQGASNTNKSMLARAYLEAVSHSKRPIYDGVKTNINETNYSDTSSATPTFGIGYLFDDDGVPAKNTNLNLNVVSDISAQTVCHVQYDHTKTLTIMDGGFVDVSA